MIILGSLRKFMSCPEIWTLILSKISQYSKKFIKLFLELYFKIFIYLFIIFKYLYAYNKKSIHFLSICI